MKETLGERIKRLRLIEGLSLRRLSVDVGVSHTYIRDIEIGSRPPSPIVLARIAQVFGVTVESLKGE